MKEELTYIVLTLAGVAGLCAGLFLIYVPAGVMSAGAASLALARGVRSVAIQDIE